MKARKSFAVIGKICKSSKDEPKEYCFKKTKNPTNSCVCVSTFQYVRGSIGVCLVCLAHRLAVVVVAVKEKKTLKRTPVGVIREETCNLPPDGVRFISVCVLAETMASFNSTTDVTVYRSASSPFLF